MERSTQSMARRVLVLGAVLMAAGLLAGCTHGGGFHGGGHPSIWGGGGYGGCQQDFPVSSATEESVFQEPRSESTPPATLVAHESSISGEATEYGEGAHTPMVVEDSHSFQE